MFQEIGGRRRKRDGDSSDEEFHEFEMNRSKKRAYPDLDKSANKRPTLDSAIDNGEDGVIVPDTDEFKVERY